MEHDPPWARLRSSAESLSDGEDGLSEDRRVTPTSNPTYESEPPLPPLSGRRGTLPSP